MTPEKRNEVMDALRIELDNHSIFCTDEAQRTDAISECDRRARAWDELRAWVADSGRVSTKMDSLIPPEPVDKLERLTSWLRDIGACESPDEIVRASALFKKIKEIQDEDR